MFIVADIGGTNMRVAASADLASFGEPVIKPTPQDYKAGIAAIVSAAQEVAHGETIEALAIGIPGALNAERTLLFNATNLPEWHGHAIVADLSEALGTRVVMENDVALVALGEAHFGAGKGTDIVMYMTISTGVNAARIVHGAIDVSHYNAQTGGQYLFNDGKFSAIGDIISGKAIEKKYKKHPKELGLGHPVWDELAEITALAVYNSILHWSPERVILGGSMLNQIGIAVPKVVEHLARINHEYPDMPEVVHAGLGDLGGLYGGLARLKQLRS